MVEAKPRFSPRLTSICVGGWLLLLLSVFLIVHNKYRLLPANWALLDSPVNSLAVPAIFWKLGVERLRDVGALGLLLASAWCVGLAVLRGTRLVERVEPLTHLCSLAVGFGCWAWFILIAGMLGSMGFRLCFIPAVLSLTLAVWHWPWLREQPRHTATSWWTNPTGFEWLLAALLLAGVLVNLVPVFSPEIEYDSVEYHLGALREYEKAGRVHFLPHNFYASMPSLTEMLFWAGITLGSTTVAKLIHFSFGVLPMLGLISLGRQIHSRQLGLIAGALFYLLPFVAKLGETSRIDLATTFFAFLAGGLVYQHLFEPGTKRLWLAGLALGLALATKYTAGPLVALPLCGVVWFTALRQRRLEHEREIEPWRDRWPSLRVTLCFVVLALLPVLPWLVKNVLFTGNPVYPIAHGLFPSPHWDEIRAERFLEHHAPRFGSWEDAATILTAVWNLSFREGFASPVLLMFVPLLLLFTRLPRKWTYCLWLGVLIYGCWFLFTYRPWRFVFPALPWFALGGAMALESFSQVSACRIACRVALTLMLMLNLNYSLLLSTTDVSEPDRIPPSMTKLGIFLGHNSAVDYLERAYSEIGFMNARLPDHAAVLYVGEPCVYYARHRVFTNTGFDRSVLDDLSARCESPEALLEELHAQGITHIYINRTELDRLRKRYNTYADVNWPLFDRFLQTHARILREGRSGARIVYEIVPGTIKEPSRPRQSTCNPGDGTPAR